MELKKFKNKAYNILGDDEFFDGLDSAHSRGIALMKIAQDKYPEIKQKAEELNIRLESNK